MKDGAYYWVRPNENSSVVSDEWEIARFCAGVFQIAGWIPDQPINHFHIGTEIAFPVKLGEK